MSKNNVRRNQLFDIYVSNLNVVKNHPSWSLLDDTTDSFLCPTCLIPISREGLQNKLITLEHIPPKGLGGKDAQSTLTCKNCNNEAGTKLDAQLQKRLAEIEFNVGVPGSEVEVRYDLGEASDLAGIMRRSEDGGLELLDDPRRSNPKSREKIDHLIETSGTFSGSYVYPVIRGSPADVALLRIAYLYAFSAFGYGFIFPNPHLEQVRQQIKQGESRILPPGSWVLPYPTVLDQPLGIYIITQPEEFHAFLVTLRLTTSTCIHDYGVVLPGPIKNGLEVYNKLDSAYHTKSDIPFSIKRLEVGQDFISDPKLAYISQSFWQSCFTS